MSPEALELAKTLVWGSVFFAAFWFSMKLVKEFADQRRLSLSILRSHTEDLQKRAGDLEKLWAQLGHPEDLLGQLDSLRKDAEKMADQHGNALQRLELRTSDKGEGQEWIRERLVPVYERINVLTNDVNTLKGRVSSLATARGLQAAFAPAEAKAG